MPEGQTVMEYAISQDGLPIDRQTILAISDEAQIETMRSPAVEIAGAWVSPKSGAEPIDEQRR
jgi:hypothetical protein